MPELVGTRVQKPPHKLEPGEYALCPYTGGTQEWFCRTPNGLLGNLAAHEVTEHEDGTITVNPSILVNQHRENAWHGWIVNGVWRWEGEPYHPITSDVQGGEDA